MKARIALLFGGASSEREVSLMGYEYMMTLLKDTEYEILPVHINEDGEWSVRIGDRRLSAFPAGKTGGGLYTECGFVSIDAAIPLLHGDGGEDGSVQGALECAGIRYVGAGICASALCLDKMYAKRIAGSLGIPTLCDVTFSKKTDVETALEVCKAELGFPMFIKPRRLGSSVGAYPVLNEDGFRRCFPLSMKAGDNLVIAERMLTDKRELECALCEIDGERIITPPGEILVDGFYGYDEKYGGRTRTEARADIPREIGETVRDYSERIADALLLRHLARIDFFLSDGKIYFNEVNTFPGFTKESLYPKMLSRYGIDPGKAVESFIKDALGW